MGAGKVYSMDVVEAHNRDQVGSFSCTQSPYFCVMGAG
jgi:hypothetical protein